VFTALFAFPLILIVGTVSLLLTGTRESPARLYLAFMTLTGVLLLLFAALVTVSQVAIGVIASVVAVGLLWFHLPKLEQEKAASIYARVAYIACAAALLTAVSAAASAAYAIYTTALRSLLTAAVLGAVAGLVFLQAWRRAPRAAPVTE